MASAEKVMDAITRYTLADMAYAASNNGAPLSKLLDEAADLRSRGNLRAAELRYAIYESYFPPVQVKTTKRRVRNK